MFFFPDWLNLFHILAAYCIFRLGILQLASCTTFCLDCTTNRVWIKLVRLFCTALFHWLGYSPKYIYGVATAGTECQCLPLYITCPSISICICVEYIFRWKWRSINNAAIYKALEQAAFPLKSKSIPLLILMWGFASCSHIFRCCIISSWAPNVHQLLCNVPNEVAPLSEFNPCFIWNWTSGSLIVPVAFLFSA